MFPGALRCILQRKEQLMKMIKHVLCCQMKCMARDQKCCFQGIKLLVVPPEEMNEIQCICWLKGTVSEIQKSF